MSYTTCLHPHCDEPMPHGRSCCRRHFAVLDPDLRTRLMAARDFEAKRYIEDEIHEWFAGRMVAGFEITPCRTKGCDVDVAWMPTRGGRTVAVVAETIEDDDEMYEHGKHQVHLPHDDASNYYL